MNIKNPHVSGRLRMAFRIPLKDPIKYFVTFFDRFICVHHFDFYTQESIQRKKIFCTPLPGFPEWHIDFTLELNQMELTN